MFFLYFSGELLQDVVCSVYFGACILSLFDSRSLLLLWVWWRQIICNNPTKSINNSFLQSIPLFLKAHSSLHNNRYGVCDATSYGCVLNAVLFILFDCLPSSKNHNLLTQWQWNIFSYAIIRRYYLRYIFHNKHSSHIGCNSYIHCFPVCINHG